MKDYYLLVGLNSKEIKILGVNQNNDGLIEVAIESKKIKWGVQYVINLRVLCMTS